MDTIYIQMGLGMFSAVMAGIVSWIGWKLQKADKRREELEKEKENAEEAAKAHLRNDIDLLKEGDIALLHNSLVGIMMECQNSGCKRVFQIENVEHMYRAYRGLGGNGTVEQMYNGFKMLPIMGGTKAPENK